jgi:hypothetical protein
VRLIYQLIQMHSQAFAPSYPNPVPPGQRVVLF